jgi:hypothetical protein
MNELEIITARAGRRLMLAWMVGLCASFALLIGCALVHVLSGGESRVPMLPLMAAGAPLPLLCTGGLLAAVVMRRARLGGFMLGAMACLAVAAAWWAPVLWAAAGTAARELEPTMPFTLTVAGLGLATVGWLLTSPDRHPLLRRLRGVLVVSVPILCYAMLASIWSWWWQSHSLLLLLIFLASVVVTVLALFALVVSSRLHAARSRRRAESVVGGRLELVCPRCQLDQLMSTGLSQCRRCGLALLIEIEEPRCPCGYLLYQLAGDTCPECGRTVRPAAG